MGSQIPAHEEPSLNLAAEPLQDQFGMLAWPVRGQDWFADTDTANERGHVALG